MAYETKQGTTLVDTANAGDEYELTQAGLSQTKVAGADLVLNTPFLPSSYTGKITSSEDGTAFALATGATSLSLTNLELTSITEFAVIAFGEDAASAQANLAKSGTTPNILSEAGEVIRSGDSTLGIMGEHRVIGIPANARDGGYAALGNGAAGDDQVVMVTQGKGGL